MYLTWEHEGLTLLIFYFIGLILLGLIIGAYIDGKARKRNKLECARQFARLEKEANRWMDEQRNISRT